VKFHIFTTGCKANQWDSYVMAHGLKDSGFTDGRMEAADLIIINACSLTNRAETDARRFIRKARQLNDKARIALVGCHAQAYPLRDFGADIVLGQREKFEVDRYSAEHGSFVVSTREFPMEKAPADGIQRGRTRFFFKIQDGCNKFCTYCVVPYARGAARSRPLDDISRTVGVLRERGIKEVVLTGIDMAAYRDPRSGSELKDLLRLLETSDTPPRIRLSSVDPEYVDDDFVSILARSNKLAPSMHIPVQSGSDQVLKRMGRRHGRDLIKEVVEKLTVRVKGIGIGMDVMVGFPGEDDSAFEETYRFIEELSVYYLHVFPYSPREGTKAAAMESQVPEAVKKCRVRRLKTLDLRKREAFSRRFIGERLVIIPEGKIHRSGLMKGFSENYLPVYVPFQKRLENNLVDVTIRGIQDGRLIGG
jgi:threonylcarbamoyladenosine tRNA methylthiotransferase MtaB